MRVFSRLCFWLALPLLAAHATLHAAGNPTRLMLDLSAKPDAVMLSAFDLCIVDAEAKVNLEAQQTLGNKMLARINIFELPATSQALPVARSIGVPVLEGPRPNTVRLDATHPGWVPLVTREIVQAAAERGFDGFVLTGLDTISQDAERAACLQAIAQLEEIYPDKQLVIEGGLDLVPEARRELEGVLFIGQASEARDARIRQVRRLGVQPLVVELTGAETPQDDIASRTAHLRSMGAVPYFTTASLTGQHLGPLKEVTRSILVLHAGEARQSFTARVLQGSLEWLGYQVRYLDASSTTTPAWETEVRGVKAVILDATLRPQPALQKPLLSLTDHLLTRHIPLLLTGAPWGTRAEFQSWVDKLGLQGSGESVTPGENPTLRTIEHAWLQNSGAIRPRTSGFRDLRAPAGARVLASVKAGPVFDQVFLASWGGLWMDALATGAGPQIQPLPFLEAWLGPQTIAPILDVATQNGRRLFIPQVSSEGFTAVTSLPGLPLAVEAMTSRLLSRYSLPFTVAVSEGDVRATNPGLDPRDALRYETAARALFALPQVHAASASFSRPDWSALPEREMQQEIAGSMAYIHRHLLPAREHVELMLWPEGSPPTPAAVAFSRQMGVENVMPLSPVAFPGHAPAPMPNVWQSGEQLQTLAPLMNRPAAGSLNAAAFIAQAEAQGRARWMSPLHLALNFHDAASDDALWEAGRVLDWCAGQPLHAMSSAEHARLVRDAAETRLFEQGEGHWILVNAGHARTLRLPAVAGIPDLNRSIGIAGYTVRGPDLYIHTLGRRRTELFLSPTGSPAHLRLAGSSGSVRYLEAGTQRALLQVTDLRPVEIAFAGIQPGALCQITSGRQPQFVMADAEGKVEFTLPPQSTMQIQVMPAQQAAMR